MILHGFAWRSSKSIVLRPENQKPDQTYLKNFRKYGTTNSHNHTLEGPTGSIGKMLFRTFISSIFQIISLGMFGKILGLLVSKMCFLSFSMQSHAESSRHFVTNLNFETDFLCNTVFSKIVDFDLQITFFDGQTVFLRFLAEIRLRTLIKSPQKASSRPKTCKFRTTRTLP